MLDFEVVDEPKGIKRAKLPGGWLVVIYAMEYMFTQRPGKSKISTFTGAPGVPLETVRVPLNSTMCCTFVSDPEYKWIIEKKEGDKND